jgi:hypothetical protein
VTPNPLLHYCFAVSNNDATAAMDTYWNTPLGILWQMVHCLLVHNGQPVRYINSKEDTTALLKGLTPND